MDSLPGVSDRVKAAVADSVVIVFFMFVFSYLFNSIGELPDNLRAITFISLFFLYDPICTSFFGGTIGHRMFQIRVKKDSNHQKNISFPMAIIRFFFKALLGWISLLTVSRNDQHKAIHDKIVGSLVLFHKK